MIRLRVLGAHDLRRLDGGEIRSVLSQPRRLALLSYLAVAHPHGFHRRDRLLALFWPEADQRHARGALNRAVYFLRRALGDGVLLSRGDEELGLDAARIWCDAAAIDDARDAGRHRDVVELYRGDLLPGFFVSSAPGFEAWLEAERDRIRAQAVDSAWALSVAEEANANLGQAVHWGWRAVELAPLHEAGVRRLLALLELAGDPAGAATAYERFVATLQAELGLAPHAETRELMDAIRRGAPRAPGQVVARAGASSPNDDLRRRDAGSPSAQATVVHARSAGDRRPSKMKLRRVTGTGGLVVAFVGGTGLVLAASKGLTWAGEVDPRVVEVRSIQNRTRDPSLDQLASTTTAALASGLSSSGLFRTVRLDQAHAGGDWVSRVVARVARDRQGRRTGIIVSGVITRDGGALRIHASLLDVVRRHAWNVDPVPISSGRAGGAIQDVGQRVIGGAAALQTPEFAALLPVATPPPTFAAFQEFAEGSRLERTGELLESQRHYRWAAALDSAFTWPLLCAARISLNKFRPTPTVSVDSILSSVALVRERLTPLQGHLYDYMVAARAQDWEGAYRAMRQVAALAPLQYGYSLAVRAVGVNQPRAAVEALTRPGMDSVHREDVRAYWLMLTSALHQLGEHLTELDAARRARERHPESVNALYQEIRALTALGRVDEVMARLDTLPSLPRDQWLSPGGALYMVAVELRAHGHLGMASTVAARAVAWHRARPADERASEGGRSWLGWALYQQGDMEEAQALFASLALEFPQTAEYVGFLGAIAARRGDRAAAAAIDTRLVSLRRPAPIPGEQATLWRAKIAALLGDRARSLELLDASFGPSGTMELHGEIDFESMADYPPFRRFVAPKG